jgi:glycosyltransferase involved in cell wall biosynthesis
MPAISVIIPTLNRPILLKRAIQSVLNQTFQDFEIIVVDDGSTEPCKNIVSDFSDQRLKYLYQKNRGLSAARNVGLSIAECQYIAYLDDDDQFLPFKLENQINLIEQNPQIGVILGGFQMVDPEDRLLGESTPWKYHDPNNILTWLLGCPTIPSLPLFRRDWLDKINGFDEALSIEEDIDLWLKLSLAGCQMEFLKEIIVKYSVNSEGISRNALAMRNGLNYVILRFFQRNDLPVSITKLRDLVFVNTYLTGAMILYSCGLIEQAGRDISQSILIQPDLFDHPDRFIEIVRNYATNPIYNGEPYAFVEFVFQNLPKNAQKFIRFKNQILGQVNRMLIERTYSLKNWSLLNQSVWKIIRHNPVTLLDRELIKTIVRVYLSMVK